MLLPLVIALDMARQPPASAAEALSEGDAHYERRAEGAAGPKARPGEIEAAIAAYRRALAADKASNAARWRLQRALFFRASFCGAGEGERQRFIDEARRVGDEGLERLAAQVKGKTGPGRIAALRTLPEAPQLYFWTAVAWGEWALGHGTLAAARQGAGSRIRELGQTVLELDPELEQGGGDRILGRLHDQSPRIPLFTGWVSRKKALEHLREALARGPLNTVNQIFLAEAIVSHDPVHKAEARRLFEQCASAAPRPEYLVEDAYYVELARRRLAEMR